MYGLFDGVENLRKAFLTKDIIDKFYPQIRLCGLEALLSGESRQMCNRRIGRIELR
jgi:hypothetical protein